MKALEIERYHNIVVLTGAGISVASGLQPYRGPGGLWELHEESLAETTHAAEDPHSTWKVFGPTRPTIQQAAPNPAHDALAACEQRLADRSFLLVTQNVDGLHQRAGSRQVVELHGNLSRTRCSKEDCDLPPFEDYEPHTEVLPLCERCGAPLRPDIVLFGEYLPVDAEWQVKKALRDCDLFIAIGTSGSVAPASNYVRGADYAGARTIYINLTHMEPRSRYFHEEIIGPAEELLPQLLG